MQEIRIPTLMEVMNERLRKMISGGALRPGDKVNVDDLARQFRISPTPIREALGRLEQDGLVARMPRIGWQVAKLSRSEFIYLHDFQKVLEQAICERLVPFVEEIDFSEACSVNETMAYFVGKEQFDRILEENEKFHLLLYEHCPNKILLETLKHTWDSLKWQRRIMIASKEYLERYFDEHVEILEALRSKDLSRIRQAVERHFHTGYLSLEKSLVGDDEKKKRGKGRVLHE